MKQDNNNKSDIDKSEILSFTKVEQLRTGSLGLYLLLRPEDIIVGVNKELFRGGHKALNQLLKENEKSILTIFRKNTFFNVVANGPLGIGLIEVGSDEDEDLIKKSEKYLKSIKSFDEYKEFEVYKGEKNTYNEIIITDISLMASFFPFVWFFHHKLYMPLILLGGTLLLLGSITWWLFLTAWVIITIYMSKGSTTLLRSYCLFNEMKIYMRIYANNNIEVQEVVRQIDKKSNYIFPLIDPPILDNIENNVIEKPIDNIKAPSAETS